jgi:PAS domain S-box-containing protein
VHPETGDVGPAELLAGVEQAADAIVIADITGKIRYVNPAFTGLTGYTSEKAIQRDVTARRAAEDAQNFLAAIVESSGDAIISFTPAGFILSWNRSAETMFGYPAGEMIGKPWSIVVLPERLAKLPPFVDRIMLGHAIPQYETICLRRDGRKIHVSVAGSPSGTVTAR